MPQADVNTTRPAHPAVWMSVIRTVFIIVAVWLFVWWGIGHLRWLDAALGIELPRWVRVPGLVAVAVGAMIVLCCGVMLSTRGIGSVAGARFMPKDFVATGPFRFVRNPMSLGGVVLMFGIALCHRLTSGLVLSLVVFLVFHLVILYAEEPGLEQRFGESYREYRRHVPRWIPRRSPWRGRFGPAV